MQRKRAVVNSLQAAVAHGGHERRAAGQEPKAGRMARHVHDELRASIERNPVYLAADQIRRSWPPVAPARTFEEIEPRDRNLGLRILHGCIRDEIYTRQPVSSDIARDEAASNSARRPLRSSLGFGGQPRMWRSTGRTCDTPPTAA